MKSKITFILIFLLVGIECVAQNYIWETLPEPPTAGRYDDISFVTSQIGWAVNSSGYIYKTTDGGNSWTSQFHSEVYFRSVKFADSLNGWAGTLDSSQVLYQTSNGGTDWELVTNIPDPKPKRICGLSVVNKNVVYGSGAYDGPAIIIKTTNGGMTWESIDISHYATNLIDCDFSTPDSGYVVGGAPNGIFPDSIRSIILFTGDGGQSWSTKYSGIEEGEWGWKINFPSPNVGYVSIENFYSASIIKKSNNNENWVRIPVNGMDDLEGIGFINDSTGWICSRYDERMTTNGGYNWQTVDIGSQINRFQFFGDSIGYAAGQNIYKYSKNNMTSVPKKNNFSKSFFLSQNYPNPFNPSTTIEYTLPKSGIVKIRIYDALGRELETLLNKFQTEGKHSVVWNSDNAKNSVLSSGFYIYRIDAGNEAESKMMLLLK